MQINVYSVETRNYCPQKVMFHWLKATTNAIRHSQAKSS